MGVNYLKYNRNFTYFYSLQSPATAGKSFLQDQCRQIVPDRLVPEFQPYPVPDSHPAATLQQEFPVPGTVVRGKNRSTDSGTELDQPDKKVDLQEYHGEKMKVTPDEIFDGITRR